MTLTLKIPSELESQLRDTAEAEGIDPADLGVTAIQEFVENHSPPDPNSESELLKRITEGCEPEWWARYKSLVKLRQSASISETELAELMKMTDHLESLSVQRLEALIKLSEIRGKSVDELKDELGIAPHPVD